MKRIGIVGGTGYTGIELLRMLVNHTKVEVAYLTSRSEAGNSVASLYPWLDHYDALEFEAPSIERLCDCDLVFYATPNQIAMYEAPELLNRGVKLIDLAADFRFSDATVWQSIYGAPHASPELLCDAVYGLPEIYRDRIKDAFLVGNPGCYPTASTLAVLPLIESGQLDLENLILDGKSGASGAGRNPRTDLIVAEASDNFHAYAASGHRHGPEIEYQLSQLAGRSVSVTFVPHLLPMIRGIEITAYIKTPLSLEDALTLYRQRYADEPLISVVQSPQHPETRWVRGSNRCVLGLYQQKPGQIIVSSVIDNLVKGAAGQAIQNMNLMLGFDETTALPMHALSP
ncbi:N-acetyl-gamma-glutamyl-phosphate reductase [Litorivicinus sp.]|nr:N-acetyl-gamma-glutamyl-phosphate reductase [Litorivicinus sp.]MDC1239744.1 N-acetyl-gamma-glutamyl-phosphate reductase [Litorivicinus sp.]